VKRSPTRWREPDVLPGSRPADAGVPPRRSVAETVGKKRVSLLLSGIKMPMAKFFEDSRSSDAHHNELESEQRVEARSRLGEGAPEPRPLPGGVVCPSQSGMASRQLRAPIRRRLKRRAGLDTTRVVS
jgi:hypothetical protein